MLSNRRLWVLYDFGNSIVTIVFAFFYAQWMVYEQGVSDIWFNILFVLSTTLLIVIIPPLAAAADRRASALVWLRLVTVLQFATYFAASVFAIGGAHAPLLAALIFLLSNFFYQASLVFYNMLLEEIATVGEEGALSGAGHAGNWLGQLAGLLLAFPFLSGKLSLFGLSERAETLFPATIASFVLVLPLLLWFKGNDFRKGRSEKSGSYRSQVMTFLRLPGILLFLCGYFLFNDAILTAGNNFPLYLQEVFGAPDTFKSLLTMGILVTAAIGAMGAGKLADRLGLHRVTMLCLWSWVVILPLMAAIPTMALFIPVSFLMGFFYGAIWSVTRAALFTLLPPGHMGMGMSFYTIAERFSSFLGPLAWSGVLFVARDLGPTRYRAAVLAMTVFILLGIVALRKLPGELFRRESYSG